MKRFAAIILLLTWSCLIRAGVDQRTGNFFITYTDIEFKGAGTDITRSYNSFTTSMGMFGYGWGTKMETRLFAFPDGTLCIKWWGGGAKDIFEPATTDSKGLFLMINEIIKYEINNDKLENNPVAVYNRKAELATDDDKRVSKYMDLVEKKFILPWIQPAGIKRIWKRNVNQVVQWDGQQYSLQNWDDRCEFNPIGMMSEIIEPDTRMKLFYTGNLLSGVLIDEKHRCNIQTDSSGKILRLFFTDSTGMKEAVFKYDSNSNLVYSKDIGNNEYWFSYDKVHNMTRISYTDSTFKEITYDPATYRAIRVKERNGESISYQYPYFYTTDGKINYLHYATRIKRYDSTGTISFTEYYEYESRTKPDGTDYLYRRLIQTDTSYDEALYNAEVGNAFYRKKNNNEAWARYDNKIRCIYLRIKDTVYICNYNLLDKTNKFWQIDSLRNDTTLYTYAYDNTGKLKETRKNNILYQVKGSRQEGLIEVKKNINLVIKFKNEKPFSIENKEWGLLLLDEKLVKTKDTKTVIDDVAMTKDDRGKTDKQEEAKALAISAMKRAQQQKSISTNDRRLLSLYEEYKDVMETKVIRHEWIWDKL